MKPTELRLEHLRHLAIGGTLEIDYAGETIEVRLDPTDVASYRKRRKLGSINGRRDPGVLAIEAEV